MKIKDVLKELRDQGGSQTLSHVINVADLMSEFAKVLGEDEDSWYYGGLLHDAGKIFVPKEVLASKNSVSDTEFEKIKMHPVAGAGVIRNTDLHEKNKATAIECSDYHHAWYNGTINGRKGYFRGMNQYKDGEFSHEAIPLVARACAICDCYEAITAERSYEPAVTPEEGVKILGKLVREGKLDPALTRTFVTKILKLEYKYLEKASNE